MDLKQLRALLAIAETGSVTKAAEILHIVQPAISRQVKLLEEELGASLFDRERHGMVLTASGHIFAEHAKRALQELDVGKAKISPKQQEISGTATVGFLPSAAEFLVSHLMARVNQTYPQVVIRSYVAYVAELEASLERGEVDVALLYPRPDSANRYPSQPILQESLYLVGAPDAALDMGTPVLLSDLNEVPLILPPLPHGVRSLIQRACEASGITLSVTVEANSMGVQKSLVMQGIGMSVLSGFVICDDVMRGTLSAAPIASPALTRSLHIAKAAGRAPSITAEKVMEELLDTVRRRVAEGRWPGAVWQTNS